MFLAKCNVNIYSPHNTLASKFNRCNGFPIEQYIQKSGFAPTCCLVAKNSIFKQAGNFDSRLREGADIEFGNRVRDMGIPLHFAKNIIMWHPARWRFSQLCKKSYRIGRSQAEKVYLMPDQYGFMAKRLFNLRTYFPKNPVRFLEKARKYGFRLNRFEAFLLSFYHIPLKVIALFSFTNEYLKRRLNR
jgi:GT2 family glycosyltransferase